MALGCPRRLSPQGKLSLEIGELQARAMSPQPYPSAGQMRGFLYMTSMNLAPLKTWRFVSHLLIQDLSLLSRYGIPAKASIISVSKIL